MGFSLHCLHVNHGIRSPEENAADAGAVRELCGLLDIPCRVVSAAQGRIAQKARGWGSGIEAAARRFRHAALNREALRLGASRILIAHTADDSLEKILMAMLRGGGPAALAGMPGERGRILRPLIRITRSQVLEYLKQRGLGYCSDSTNKDTSYLRNRVRLVLIPLLDSAFPGWRRALTGLGETQGLLAAWLEESAGEVPWEAVNGTLTLDEGLFFSRSGIVREEILYRGIDSLGAGEPKRGALRLFAARAVRGVDLGSGGKQGPGYRLERKEGKLVLSPVRSGERGFALVIEKPGLYDFSGLRIEVKPGAALDAGAGAVSRFSFRASLPLVLRGKTPRDEVAFKARLWSPEKNENLAVVEDRDGIAACFGLAGGHIKDLLYTRNITKDLRSMFCIIHSGGLHGKQE
jgi:tRNA(Ile)-lysidine synthase